MRAPPPCGPSTPDSRESSPTSHHHHRSPRSVRFNDLVQSGPPSRNPPLSSLQLSSMIEMSYEADIRIREAFSSSTQPG